MQLKWPSNLPGRVCILAAGVLIGCSPHAAMPPMNAATLHETTTPWIYDGQAGHTITTDHYALHTTIADTEFVDSLARLMEGAYSQYQKLAPTVAGSTAPMDCYIFARRPEWAEFTKQHTGDDAAIYLQINRGGYTIRDWYVAYFIGSEGTYAVAAHEGWHQYVARHFHSRLPPFLEEGIATMFENIAWDSSGPAWRLASNPNRAEKLQTAIEDGQIWPLDQLCTMHAGDVVSLSGERIETFYAQNWAFAHFLLYADRGKYKLSFQKMLTDLASGEADQWTGRRRAQADGWDPRTVKPLLEHYLAMPMPQIDQAYQAYVRKIAYGKAS